MPENSECRFVDENEFMFEEIPAGVSSKFRSPRSICLGVDDALLDATVFTNVKMKREDFERPPKRLPRLLFAAKNRLNENPALGADLSPAAVLLEGFGSGLAISGCTQEVQRKLRALLCDNYLLLPLYLNKGNCFAPYGVDVVCKNLVNAAPGKLLLSHLLYRGSFLFGKRYDEYTHTGLPVRWARVIWRYQVHSRRKADILGWELRDYDIEQIMEETAPCMC